jgi:hypothetical protein
MVNPPMAFLLKSFEMMENIVTDFIKLKGVIKCLPFETTFQEHLRMENGHYLK